MIRFILTALFLLVFFIVSIPLYIIELIIGLINKDLSRRSSLAIVSWAFRVVAFLAGVKLTVKGEENVPKDEAVLYIGNHLSYFDVVLTYCRVPRPTGYIAKKEFLKVPFLSWWMLFLDCLFMDRSDVKQSAQIIFSAIDKIKSGISICIYPEGTRSKDETTIQEFHKGSFKPAQRTNCPIVPMIVTHTRDIFENHLPFLKSTHVVLEYLPPVRFSDLSKEDQKQVHEYFRNMMQEAYTKNLNEN
ncbi:1-acyl-sn-glycerol-3-phosphate acyltransferase [Butyrivibrio fibrisolvens DSM 3071]|uniref:1-acyl-sn-glycerol-3-phosphate acyltransferase n=1 Tax=Butyrivibrio fibrisolvens DSM 3071 TaxID=1121131 RepID=A0A1M6B4Z9_BUTFI|nr:lysophospholipid acyltransferase family protein [Butyrivibrio fibrisolvens]SHI43775.1 1-acyl-sn-glycerol-3-phosphate acyltransferase [Butyrivibrio fibrisolvens DSM 3071]